MRLFITRFALSIAALAFGALSLTAVPASAAPSNPAGIVEHEFFQSEASGLPAGTVVPAASIQDTCKTFTFGVNTYGDAGNWLSRFVQHVGWCYNGIHITTHSVLYEQATAGGVQYDGRTSETHESDAGNTFWHDAATAKFKWCPTPIPCYGEWYPWISTVVRANGTADGSGSPS